MMKFRFFFCLLVIACFVSCSKHKPSLVGEWQGVDQSGKSGKFFFDNTDHCTIVVDNEIMGGKEFVADGRKCEFKYKVNYSHIPYGLDFNCYDIAKKERLFTMKCIFKFITDKKIEIKIPEIEEDRPTDFSSKGEEKNDLMILTKVSKPF